MYKSEYDQLVAELRRVQPVEEMAELASRMPGGAPAQVMVGRLWTNGTYALVERREYVGQAEDYRLQAVTEQLLDGQGSPVSVEPDPEPDPQPEGGAD